MGGGGGAGWDGGGGLCSKNAALAFSAVFHPDDLQELRMDIIYPWGSF